MTKRSATLHAAARSFAIILLAMLVLAPVSAGDIALNINSGDENEVFWIEGEPSLVINGFDLSAYAEQMPLALDAVTLSVETPVPGGRVIVAIYEDATGGAPHDATLVYRQLASINSAGVVRIALDEPGFIRENVAWVGFYLPVGFHFHADKSGESALTWWAWTPGGTFDLTSPARAVVLGAGNGSEPVNIQMDGIARIGAEIRSATAFEVARLTPLGEQVADTAEVDTSSFIEYSACPGFLYDPADTQLEMRCLIGSPVEPPVVIMDAPEGFLDVQRAGDLYKIVVEDYGALPNPMTHCVRVPEEHIDIAILGEARDIPERWYILPSVRYGDLVCADVSFANYVSYFLPRDPDAVQNVNLVVGWSKVEPHPAVCGLPITVNASIVNTGRQEFFTDDGTFRISVENLHLPSGFIDPALDITVDAWRFKPGDRHGVPIHGLEIRGDKAGTIGDRYRLTIRADTGYQVEEISETDNIWATEYILRPFHESYACFEREPADGILRYPPVCEPDRYPPRGGQAPMPGSDINRQSYGYAVRDFDPAGFGRGAYGFCNCLKSHYIPDWTCLGDYMDHWGDALDYAELDRGTGACPIKAADISNDSAYGNYDAFANCMSRLPIEYSEEQVRAIWNRFYPADE